jgi:hypothetical protein
VTFEIADAGAIWQHDRHRRLQAALPPACFEDVRDGAGTEGITLEGARDGRPECLRTVVIEQRHEADEVVPQRFALRGEALERVAASGTARRRRSRAVDGLSWRVAATRPATWASCSTTSPLS